MRMHQSLFLYGGKHDGVMDIRYVRNWFCDFNYISTFSVYYAK